MNGSVMSPPLSSSDVLIALGLERRRTVGRKVLDGLGLAAAGVLVGASAVLLGGALLGRSAESHRAAQHDTAAQGDV
jgi:hypothetical protein